LGKKRRRQRKLDAAVASIQRRYGPLAVVKGKAPTAVGAETVVPHISTGFPLLDRTLGIGGLPKGRACELLGLPTSGKTTLALKFLAQAQSHGEVAYIDQASYFDPDYAHRCGVNLSQLVSCTPQNAQETLYSIEALVRSGSLSALVLDTLDFLWIDPGTTGQLAATLKRLAAPLADSGTILLALHESAAGSSPSLTALGHIAAVRLQVVRERWVRHYGDVRGYVARVEVLKNKRGPTGGKVTIAIKFNGTVRGNGL
jgi:recombination protein RecA